MSDLFPKNEEYFKRLIVFTKKVFSIFETNNLEFFIYGSLALFYYVKDSSLPINDVDLMMHKKDMPILTSLLDEEGISYDVAGNDIFIREGDLLIEVDILGFGDKELIDSLELNSVFAYGLNLPLVSLDTVELIYAKARDYPHNSDQDKILQRVSYLESFLGRPLKY